MDKKDRVLKAALKLFVEFGFHDTPTSKIAKEAEVATGTLFYFFATKDELVKTLYIEIKGCLTNHITEAIKTETTLHGILKGYYVATLQWALEHKTEFRFIEQFNTSPYLNQIASEEIEKHIKPVMDILRNGITAKIIKPLDAEIIFTLIGAHTYAINQYLVTKKLPKTKQHKIINETFDLLWEMIT